MPSVKDLYRVLSEGEGYVDIMVYVKPEAPEEKLVFEEGDLVYYTPEPPIEGRANASLTRYLSRILGKPTSRIEIVHGVRSRSKRVRVYDASLEELVEKLAEALGISVEQDEGG